MLAAFALRVLRESWSKKAGPSGPAVAELGSGCGAALLGLALGFPRAHCLGIEREPVLVEAANANAFALNLSGRVQFRLMDVASAALKDTGSQDLVMANPPWACIRQRGRPSPSRLREAALCAATDDAGDSFQLFSLAAARILRHRGKFCCIAPTGALSRICAALESAGLGLRRIIPLRPRTHKPAHRLLLLAQKNAVSEPQLFSPLTLHASDKADSGKNGQRWTAQAIAFCPWLAPGMANGKGKTGRNDESSLCSGDMT